MERRISAVCPKSRIYDIIKRKFNKKHSINTIENAREEV